MYSLLHCTKLRLINQVTQMNPWKIAFKYVGPNQLKIIVVIP